MNNSTNIDDLWVAHWSQSSAVASSSNEGSDAGGSALVLDTCLRQMRIGLRPVDAQHELLSGNPDIRYGRDAYQFILEITTGLRSAIPGETNVFGQFKNAWRRFRTAGQPAHVARLAPIIHQLINDTKAIRKEYLEGIGSSSYGGLVRRLIAPNSGDRILFIGAGGLARSMLPLFRRYELGLWHYKTIAPPVDLLQRYFDPAQGDLAAGWADHVILTTPPDTVNDGNWQRRLATASVRTVVHLGQRRSGPGTWGDGLKAYTLDDVFALRREQTGIRSQRLLQARVACRRHARQHAKDNGRLSFARLAAA